MFPRCFIIVLAFLAISVHPARAADLDTMIGQMLMAGFRGYDVDEDSTIIEDIRQRQLGGVILFDRDMTRLFWDSRNIKNPEQVRRLTDSLKGAATIPLLVAVDQEGGKVQRLKAKYGFATTPSAQELGGGPDSAVLAAAGTIGSTLNSVGFNLDFAPVADVNINPDSPAIGALGRSFSADPKRVAACDRLFMDGLMQHGIIGCLKHFPGHGSAGSDSHLGLTDVTDTWSDRELIPYRRLIADGTARVIMTAHIFNAHLDPEYPATLSHKVITGLLRGELGFNGVVITDDMNMKAITAHFGPAEAVRLAIQAGADILLFGNNLDYDPQIVRKAHTMIRKLVDSGEISETRIEQSYARIMRLKEELR